jgi:hemerythrin-like domain-containing protein
MTLTEKLRYDHDVILEVLDGAERAAASTNTTGHVDTDAVGKMIDFFHNFADNYHHRKEEEHLFLKLVEYGMPIGQGPIAVMMHEHESGRRLIKTIEKSLEDVKSGDTSAPGQLAASLASYVELLRDHIQKENEVLFPMAESMLSPADKDALLVEFERIDSEQQETGTVEQYYKLAHSLG